MKLQCDVSIDSIALSLFVDSFVGTPRPLFGSEQFDAHCALCQPGAWNYSVFIQSALIVPAKLFPIEGSESRASYMHIFLYCRKNILRE